MPGARRATRGAAPRSERAATPCAPDRSRRTRRPRAAKPKASEHRGGVHLGAPAGEVADQRTTPRRRARCRSRPPISASVTASTRNCEQDVAAARADRHAQADLARALGDRHQHDVHDADAADQQRHRRDGGQQQREDLRRLASCACEHLGQVAHEEVVLLARLQPVPLAQQVAHLLPRSPSCRRRRATLTDDRCRRCAQLAPACRRARACSPSRSASARRRPGPGRSCSGPCARARRSRSAARARMRTRLAHADRSSPNSFRATVCPSSTTLAAPLDVARRRTRGPRRRPVARLEVVGGGAVGSASTSCCCRTTTWPRAAQLRRGDLRPRRPRAASRRRRPR